MKVRTDFVSNSSSCSFVLNKDSGGVAAGFNLFARTFANCDVPYDFADKIRISMRAKNKNFKELYSAFHDGEPSGYRDTYEDWSSGKVVKKDPEEIGWDSVETEFGAICDVAPNAPRVFDLIEEVSFTTEDSDYSGMMYLKLLYLFFERNNCFPDATNTEHSFMDDSEEGSFFGRLCSTVPTGEKGTEK